MITDRPYSDMNLSDTQMSWNVVLRAYIHLFKIVLTIPHVIMELIIQFNVRLEVVIEKCLFFDRIIANELLMNKLEFLFSCK